MKQQNLIDWLRMQQPILDQIIANAGREFHDRHQTRPNFAFDLGACQAESFNLAHNQDLCYDRPNTAFCYSLWYHARRVNTFLTHFAHIILQHDRPTLECFDLGAGTGAVQWAIGLLYHWKKASGQEVSRIRIINIDTSPFMLHYSRDFLWKHFLLKYPHCRDFNDDIEYEVNSWNNKRSISVTDAWITASYLFDISDTSDTGDYRKAVLDGFQEIRDAVDPSKLFLLTSASKEHMMDEVSTKFKTDYIIERIKNKGLLLSGALTAVNQFRSELLQQYNQQLITSEERSIGNAADWYDPSFVAAVLTKRRIELFTERQVEKIRLHDASIKVRRDVVLNEEQEKAARNVNQPTVIIGPAGCGKSIIITERIKNIVEEADYDPNLRILVTTFNKELLGQLANWISDVLKAGRFKLIYDKVPSGQVEQSCKFYFNGSNIENIRLLHFDMLPKYIGKISDRGSVNEFLHKTILSNIIKGIKKKNKIKDERFDNILNPEFLMEEYHRVIYGLQVGIKNARQTYLNVSRIGRGNEPQLKKNSERRELVWECIERYVKHIYEKKIPCFTKRRWLFLLKLVKEKIKIRYDYVLVDEFQDCTKADFVIFFYLLKHPDNLVIAGDLAQSIQLGKSATVDNLREAIREGKTMNDIKWNYLEGSYRLPFRICEAVKKISEHIKSSFRNNHAAGILTPCKGAPPGARPIVLYGRNEKDIADKIRDIIKAYSHFDLAEKCILEKDPLLQNELQIPTDTVLRLKGLEKHCVIWSTRVPIEFKKEKFEFVYTILSRTSCLLIIALFDDPDNPDSRTPDVFKEAIGLLRSDRMIFWDKETKDNFKSFCGNISDDGVEEDEDN